ncbi:MAG TPA: hypothetical protein VFV58_12920 [Blastocatellia bacterium]|jgi:hypothetical protein|nr:hypothetical protein [Blastocatellia bacterium]
MSTPEHFEILKDHAIFRPAGQVSIEQAVELVTAAITFAHSRHIRKLLIDVSNLTGFKPPGVAMRYFFIQDWARAAAGSVRVALVSRPELIDHQKFGATVAANRGFTADAFLTEQDALTWLERVK